MSMKLHIEILIDKIIENIIIIPVTGALYKKFMTIRLNHD